MIIPGCVCLCDVCAREGRDVILDTFMATWNLAWFLFTLLSFEMLEETLHKWSIKRKTGSFNL